MSKLHLKRWWGKRVSDKSWSEIARKQYSYVEIALVTDEDVKYYLDRLHNGCYNKIVKERIAKRLSRERKKK